MNSITFSCYRVTSDQKQILNESEPVTLDRFHKYFKVNSGHFHVVLDNSRIVSNTNFFIKTRGFAPFLSPTNLDFLLKLKNRNSGPWSVNFTKVRKLFRSDFSNLNFSPSEGNVFSESKVFLNRQWSSANQRPSLNKPTQVIPGQSCLGAEPFTLLRIWLISF